MHSHKNHRTRKQDSYRILASLTLGVMLTMSTVTAQAEGKYGIGHAISVEQLAPWNINVFSDGENLPPGNGTVAHGKNLFAQQCASCHGAKGEGGTGDKLSGGIGTLASTKPVKTVGSFWPYAPTLFDYIRRAMPLTAPQSLSNDQVYAVTAYVLHLNGLLADNATLDAKSLSTIRMPNRDGFSPDTRPDVGQK